MRGTVDVQAKKSLGKPELFATRLESEGLIQYVSLEGTAA